jgi:hypothetical protein
MQGLVDTFCKVTEWSNGEGFDISFETKTDNDYQTKRIDVHVDELECLFACLNDFKYFEN